MQLEKPVDIQFKLAMTTERAYMAQNIVINGETFITETCALPKMYTDIISMDNDIATAQCEFWILQQRKVEDTNNNVSTFAEELLSM